MYLFRGNSVKCSELIRYEVLTREQAIMYKYLGVIELSDEIIDKGQEGSSIPPIVLWCS